MSANNTYTTEIPKGYYVYAYLRESDFSPYYIGKGKGRRAWSSYKRHCGTPTNRNYIIILASNLNEQNAFFLEKNLISFYGRKNIDTGILRNLTNGGDGVSGFKYTDEQKRLMAKPGILNGMYGKTHTKEVKHKLSLRQTIKNKNSRWYNNGIKNTYSTIHPGEGWSLGRLYQKPTTEGYHWYNNGKEQVSRKERPEGDEWVLGKLVPKEEKNCIVCEKKFTVTPCRKSYKCCSKACNLKSRPQVVKVCLVCKKDFSVFRSIADKRKTCSKKCIAKHISLIRRKAAQ